jgi:hypothetical protein
MIHVVSTLLFLTCVLLLSYYGCNNRKRGKEEESGKEREERERNWKNTNSNRI